MNKTKISKKRQFVKYMICITIGFVLYPVSMIFCQRIENYIENKKEIFYPEQPVPFVLYYLNSWEKGNYGRMCNMMSDQLRKEHCISDVKTNSITIKDVMLREEDKESAIVYVYFEIKNLDGIQKNYWTFDLIRNKKNNRWEVISYGTSG